MSGQSLIDLIHKAGFEGQAAQIMYGIVLAESGGNARALADDDDDYSFGLAQINMIGSLGPARLQQYGLSSYSDLYDPLTNLRVAYQLSNHGTNFSPWTTYTSGAYRSNMGGGYNAVVTNGGGGGAPVNVPNTAGGGGGSGGAGDRMTRNDYAGVDSLGDLLDQIPELRHLVDQAVANNWSPEKFQNAVEDSAWWKNHSQTARAVLIEKANDPATWSQDLRSTKQSINGLARQLGFTLTADQLEAIANSALLTGNTGNQQWLTQQIGRRQDYSHLGTLDKLQGGMAATAQQLQELAADYGMRWDASTTALHAQDILMGHTTIDTYKQRLIDWAKSAFPALAQQIAHGATVKDLADPYVQSMSQLLEMSPAQINLYTPMIRQALQGTSGKDGLAAVTPLWQFENQLREDPRWATTSNAHESISNMLMQIGQSFGFNG